MASQPPIQTLPMRATPPVSAAVSRYPFIPFGLVPLVGLLAVMIVALVPFAFGEVQGVAEASARQALREVGADWADAHASGQWVILEGRPESKAEAARAVAAVKAFEANTIFGRAAPVTWVIEHFTWAEDPLTPDSISQPGPAPAPEEPAVSIPPGPEAAACDRTMSGLLASARLEFPTSSAAIGAASKSLLDSIAMAALACPGSLRIEGYTDDHGRDDYNTALSKRRAEAVRAALVARGVPGTRLIAEGKGDQRPVASNDTEDGRARNRRIEIHPVASPSSSPT